VGGPEQAGIYLHARYYDSEIGVFLSPDPIGVEGGLNQYGYALGNPTNRLDRSGLVSCKKRANDDTCDVWLLDPVVNDPITWGEGKMNAPTVNPGTNTPIQVPGGSRGGPRGRWTSRRWRRRWWRRR
jgi:uncharacterized protein RhaS with RHS repeats